MVVHQPGPWLGESLRSLASQDYPSLQILVLVSGTEADEGARGILDVIETEAPRAVVRFVGGNAGFAASCNLVLNLVEGDSGFFCFIHDDVALMPGAIGALVEELYRSNAGVVGPKLVHWEDPRMIQSVGSALDRFGVELALADDGEIDQEQHDAVQDVFAVSSACMLIRADLFRTLGGFNADLALWGAEVDLCWRCHAASARVVVVPAAVGRHRASAERSGAGSGAEHMGRREADRLQMVAALTAANQLPFVLVQATVITLVRAAMLTVTGRVRRAGAELGGLFSLLFSIGDVRARRARVARYRSVTGSEIRALQLRGSAHVASYFRRRAMRAGTDRSVEAETSRETTARSSVVLWCVLAAMLLIGSRSLLANGVSAVGQFVPVGDGPRGLVAAYSSGWWGAAFGQMSAAPTGMALVAVAGVLGFGNMELVRTMSVVLLPLIGWIGMWRFGSVLGSRASRIAGTAAYAAVPLPYSAIAAGRWGALLVYACLPWIAHLGRMLVGHRAIGDAGAVAGREEYVDLRPTHWRRAFATLALVLAVCIAFEPGVLLVLVILAATWAVVTAVHSGSVVRAVRWLAVTGGAGACAILLNVPWASTYAHRGWWEAVTGAPVENGRDWGLVRLASFGVGHFALAVACLALYAAVVGAALLVHGPKTPWALRGAALAGTGLLLAVLDDAALLPAHLPEPAVMLVPVAFGIAVCAAAMGAMLVADLRRGRFSWRQPLGALLAVVFLVGLAPVPLNAIDGSWNQSSFSLPRLLAQLPSGDGTGDYRTLFVGDARVLPGAPANFGWGVSFSVVNGPSPTLVEMWETPANRLRDETVAALYGIVRGRTSRAGRLLAPLAVRFIVVPVIDGAASTREEPVAVPRGLVDALSRQLDLKRKYASPDMVVFENTAWLPVRAQMTQAGAEASQRAGAESMITEDVSGAVPLGGSTRPDRTARVEAAAGTVHLAVPYSTRWTLESSSTQVPARPAFGLTNGYDVTTAGTYTLRFDTSPLHTALVLLQLVAWCLFGFVMLDRRSERRSMPRPSGAGLEQSTAPVIAMGQQGLP